MTTTHPSQNLHRDQDREKYVDEEIGEVGRKQSSNFDDRSMTVQGITFKMKPIVASLAYAFCSISMIFANRQLLSDKSFGFKSALFLLAFQNSCAFILVLFKSLFGSTIHFDTSKAVKWVPVNLAFLVMLFTSFKALENLTVAMVTVLKNLNNLLILSVDWYYFRQTVNRSVISSILLMLVGAILAGYNDMHFDFVGYCWMFLNCCSTTFYVNYAKYAMDKYSMTKDDANMYNVFLSVPSSALLLLVSGDLAKVRNSHSWIMRGFFPTLSFSGCLGFFLGIASFWCLKSTSPTTYSIVGTTNKAVIAVIGIFILGESSSLLQSICIFLSLLGGGLYAFAKVKS